MGLRKILDLAHIVEIEMGEHDVTHVARRIAKRLHLPDRRFALAEPGVEEKRPGARQSPLGMAPDILYAIPGIDENQAVFGLDQKAMGADVGEEAFARSVEQRASEGQCEPQLRW